MKELPKYITSKMTAVEKKKLDKLVHLFDLQQKDMVAVQSAYVIAARKGLNDKDLRKLADKGFLAESKTFAAADRVKEYQDKLRIKYS